MTPPLVLSLQSHVAFGHVGNAVAVFALQRLGVEVVAVNTCQLSNHTGYPDFSGRAFDAAEIIDVLHGLERRGVMDRLDGVLSGWLGRAALGEAIAVAVERSRQQHATFYLCDPVMGDDTADGEGRLYAASDIPALVRDRLLPLADAITPNRFELALLSGHSVTTLAEAVTAARGLLRKPGADSGPRFALVSSVPFPDPQRTGCVVVTPETAEVIETDRLVMPYPVNGGGDVLSALLLAHHLKGLNAVDAARRSVAGLFAVLEETQRSGERELALIAAQDRLAHSLSTSIQGH